MKNLYIDFDGVILDTITPVYNLAKKLNLDVKTQTKEVGLLYSKIDWEELINESPALSDSIDNIKKLMLESPEETIIPLLESFGFAHILPRNGSIRFARSEEGGRNISIRLQDNEFLNVHDFVTSAHKDIFSYICEEKSVEFKDVLCKAKEILGLDNNWRPPQRKLLFGGIYQNIGKNIGYTPKK